LDLGGLRLKGLGGGHSIFGALITRTGTKRGPWFNIYSWVPGQGLWREVP